MQQFWHTIKKVQGTNSYEFILANKKCVVNADVFKTILDICPRVKGVDFTDVPDDDTALAFLIKLGYKGPLYKHTNMFVDHMHQPWRMLAAIINKCLSGKTTSNDKLRKSRIDIPWGMFKRENVDYPELIWEDLTYQIDHRKEKKSRHQNHIKCSTNTQLVIFPRKKSRGKGSKRKKTIDDSQETVDVSEEFEPEPEPVKKRTSSKKRVKKTVTIYAEDNIIPNPDVALELGKSISLTEAEEAEASRKVHATHVRIITESVPTPARRRSSETSHKLKGFQYLTL
ncbi:hypothetical protein Tco_0931288 [Tanacetum coccineum]